jgi:hypothetical protein
VLSPWSIPLIILCILDDGVNFRNNLASIYTTFIYIICGIEFGFTKNGSTLLKLKYIWIFNLFCTNCPSHKLTSCIILKCFGFIISSIIVLHSLYPTFVVPWHTPKLLDRFKCESKGENNGRIRSWVRFLACNTSKIEGRARALKWGLGQVISESIIHTDLHKPNNKLICA